jgi:hypothetical protein
VGRRTLEVQLENKYCAYVRGYGSRQLLMQFMNNKPPLWSHRHRAWVCAEHTARSAIAAAEHAGYDVIVNGPRAAATPAPVAMHTTSPGEQPDPGAGLW